MLNRLIALDLIQRTTPRTSSRAHYQARMRQARKDHPDSSADVWRGNYRRYETMSKHRQHLANGIMCAQRIERYNTEQYTPAQYSKMLDAITAAYYRERARLFPGMYRPDGSLAA